MDNRLSKAGTALLASALCGAVGTAQGFAIDTGNHDLQLRLDNTVRANYVHRIESQDSKLLALPNNDDGNRNFDTGMVSARIDLLTESDLVYKGRHGVRVSAASWYDYAYRDLDNNDPATSNYLENGAPAVGLSRYAERYYEGPSGEILDAFVFTQLDVGSMPVNVRAGRHVVYWGESLMGNGALHGITYAQTSLDLGKASAVPGTEAKELFRPLNQISLQARPNNQWSLAAQYFFEWEEFRIPEAGTFLGNNDLLLRGGGSLVAGGGTRIPRGRDATPDDRGEFGLAARWTPGFLGSGTLGFYYRNFSDKLPQAFINTTTGRYGLAYADDINLYGISLTKQVGGLSMGAEVSYREDMPLVSDAASVAQIRDGDAPGARGNTYHALVNVLGVRPGNALWDTLSWAAELTYMRVDEVTENESLYKGRSSYDGVDKVTDDYVGLALNLTPTVFQALPSVDLLFPVSVSYGLHGNAAVTAGGNEDGGNYSLGVAAEVMSRYRFDLRYTDYFGENEVNNAGARIYNGTNAQLHDRGNVSLTFKTTF
jgi:hypothetical protein